MSITTNLQKIGLNANRTAVYLACLKLGSSTVADIAAKAGIRRTTTYNILTELKEDDLVEEDPIGSIKRFIALPPTKLVELLASKQTQAEKLLPELMKLFQETTEKPRIHFYTNLRGLKAMMEDALSTKEKIIRSFSPTVEFVSVMGPVYTRHYIQQRKKLGIERRALRPYTRTKSTARDWEFLASDQRVLRQVRFLPERVDFRIPIQIYDQKFAIMDLEQQYGFIVENSALAIFQKQIFDILWNLSAE